MDMPPSRQKTVFAVVTLSLLLISSASVGLFVGAKRVGPIYSTANDVYYETVKTNSPAYNTIPPETEQTDVSDIINIRERSDVNETRDELIRYIWGESGFPRNRKPTTVSKNITDNRYSDIANLHAIDQLEVSMRYGVNSRIYHFRPSESNGKLVIYHQGHRGGFVNGKDTIETLVNQGYSVIAISMPLEGMNNQPVVSSSQYGSILIDSHDDFYYLQSDVFSPISYFLTPVAVSTNYAQDNYNYTTISMVGISGGGWTTTVYSAIDSRVSRSYPVAGTHPTYLRPLPPHDNIGDYEQSQPELYQTANYLDLYILGSTGEGRKQIQILNKYDPCCYAGVGARTYAPAVENASAELGGEYELIIDDSHRQHQISEQALEIILDDLSSQGLNE